MIWLVTLPCCVTLRAGSGDDRPCSSRRLKAVSCRCLSFFSSLLHCCRRLFLTDLLKFSSPQSFRAASYIFIWSAREASTELNFESCKGYGSLAERQTTTRGHYSIVQSPNLAYTSAPRGILSSSSLNAAPTRRWTCGAFSPGCRG